MLDGTVQSVSAPLGNSAADGGSAGHCTVYWFDTHTLVHGITTIRSSRFIILCESSEEEISSMDKELERLGIQMPKFNKIGGLLAKEVRVLK